jgi:hypothetical protein
LLAYIKSCKPTENDPKAARPLRTPWERGVSELVGWFIVLGLAIALIGIYLLFKQIKEHRRDTAEIMLQSNDMMLAHLKRLSDPSAEVKDPMVGVILERRCSQRRARHSPFVGAPGASDHRRSPGRRAEDLRIVQGSQH